MTQNVHGEIRRATTPSEDYAAGVRVKPLEWFDKPEGQDVRIGRCGEVSYGVECQNGSWGYRREGQVGLVVGRPWYIFRDEQDAMRGAEEDHETRIRSALLPAGQPAPAMDVREAARVLLADEASIQQLAAEYRSRSSRSLGLAQWEIMEAALRALAKDPT